jgi:hypothetical protein
MHKVELYHPLLYVKQMTPMKSMSLEPASSKRTLLNEENSRIKERIKKDITHQQNFLSEHDF